jgi:hypothetical protein
MQVPQGRIHIRMYSQFEAWYAILGPIFQTIITFLHIVTTISLQQDKSVIYRWDIFDKLFELFPKHTFINKIDIG